MKKISLMVFVVLALALVAMPALAQADGAATFKGKCTMCHGADGSGDTAMGKKVAAADLRDAKVQSKADDELISTVIKGKNKMPAFEEKLSPEQIKAVIAFIRTLKK